MNSTIENLINRRSVRKFKTEQIKDDELKQILLAGTYAPTGMNKQSPKIVVIQNKETINELSNLNAKFLWTKNPAEKIDPFYGAPTIIVVLADKNVKTFVEDVAEQIAKVNPADVEELLEQTSIKDSNKTVKEVLTDKIAKIGENMTIRRFERFESNGLVEKYIHGDG